MSAHSSLKYKPFSRKEAKAHKGQMKASARKRAQQAAKPRFSVDSYLENCAELRQNIANEAARRARERLEEMAWAKAQRRRHTIFGW